jgi:RHS repeat-associated protein
MVASVGNLTYTYDPAGNRATVGGSWARTGLPQAVLGATYDAGNRLATWGAQRFSYDANGNLGSDGPTSYTWNARNQLTALSGGVSAGFAYDGVGRRRSKTISSTTTNFLYDGLNFVQELTSSGTPTANLLTGGRLDETFTRTDGNGTSTFLVDALGSTVALADTSGVAQTQYTFDPFGATTASGATSANAAQFTGRENDATGAYFYRARYYSPGKARFIAEDPLGYSDGPNAHLYAHDSPALFNDPSGLETWDWPEFFRDIWNVGPADAWRAYNLSTQALSDAKTSGLPGLRNGPADAFRHCLWSCQMTQAMGADKAKLIGDEHENEGDRHGQPRGERKMDEANNDVGRKCRAQTDPSGKKKDCYDGCMNLLFSGQLFGLDGTPMPPPQMPRPTR